MPDKTTMNVQAMSLLKDLEELRDEGAEFTGDMLKKAESLHEIRMKLHTKLVPIITHLTASVKLREDVDDATDKFATDPEDEHMMLIDALASYDQTTKE